MLFVMATKVTGTQVIMVILSNEPATKREHHTLNSWILKQAEGSRNTFKKLCQRAFACRIDALAAVVQWQKKQVTLAVKATVIVVPVC